MFKKITTFILALIMIALFNVTITKAQTTNKSTNVFPVFSISPTGGVQFPIGGLNETYKPGFNLGLDLNLRINKETAFYLNTGYFNMQKNSDLAVGPNASYIAITAGPRYFFTSSEVKAMIFLEAGVGVYIHNKSEYTTNGTPVEKIASETNTAIGVNAGPGVIIPLGKAMDLIMKAKIHDMFEKGGERVFISSIIGLNFKL